MLDDNDTPQHPEEDPEEGFLSWQFDCHINHLNNRVITHNGVVGLPQHLNILQGYVGVYADLRYLFIVHSRRSMKGKATPHSDYFPKELLLKLEEWRRQYAARKRREAEEREKRAA